MLRFSWILAFWMARCVGASSKNDDFPPRRGLKPDPFVQAAPLIVAMSCRDGVAILAAHPAPSSEPLLFYDYNEDEPVTVNDESSLTKTADGGRGNPPLFLDLPLNYEGSLRIQAVGTAGTTALVTCGWRVDGTGRLVTVARERTDIERQTFGEENSSILPTQLSLYMAMCAVSERVRPLSCAAFVAYCGANNVDSSTKSGENASAAGCLWLVDETGAYPVRAHCIGGGLTTMTTTTTKGEKAGVDTSTTVPVSDVVNRLLLEILRKERAVGHVRRPYFDLTAEEALEKLLVILLANESEDNPSSHGPLLPHGTRLELATVDSSQQRIVRKRVSDIWGRRMASHVTSV